MFDTFRGYESWYTPDGKALNTDIGPFWTWGGADSVGTLTLTAIGMLVMVISIIGWVWLEKQKLDAQAARLRAAGFGSSESGD